MQKKPILFIINLNKTKVNLSKLVYALAFTVLFSCSNNENEEVIGAEKAKVSDFIENYANIVSANYTDT
ncbi:MAG: hypothetical protein P8P15_08645 [Polaribacter sp.]|nr:hypothetical protein [Polaribacter sp.]